MERVVIEFAPGDYLAVGTDFFVVVDSISPGTTLLSDRVTTAPICHLTSESHRSQVMRDSDGNWLSGEFSYAMTLDAEIVQTPSANRFVRAGDRYQFPAIYPSGFGIAASDVNADSRIDLFIGGRLFVNQPDERLEEVSIGEYAVGQMDSSEVFGFFLEIDGNDQPEILRISRPHRKGTELDTGVSTTEYTLEIFHNQQGSYAEKMYAGRFIAEDLGALIIGDPDGNDNPDVLITGANEHNQPVFSLLRSTADGIRLLQHDPLLDALTEIVTSPVSGGQFVDVDLDGDADLSLALREVESPLILLNVGSGSWAPAYNVVSEGGRGRIGCDWGDYDGDGDLDLLHPSTVHPFEWESGNPGISSILVNRSLSALQDTMTRVPFIYGRTHAGGVWFDADNDGDLEAFLAVDEGCASGRIFSFDKELKAYDISPHLGMAWNRLGPDVLVVDLDNNGFQDLVGFEDGFPVIYLNQPVEEAAASDRQGTTVELRSESGRTLSYGRVEAHIGDRTIVRYLAPTHGRHIGNAPVVHFATAADERIDSFVVRYPDGVFESYPGTHAGEGQLLTRGDGRQLLLAEKGIGGLAAVPNPFTREVTLFFSVAQSSSVRVEIFDPVGNLIRTIVPQDQVSGHSSVVWDGTNERGDQLPSGQYFYRISSEASSAEGRVILMR